MKDENTSSSIQERPSPTGGASFHAPRQQSSSSLDDYDIIREIGRGGTAIVYEAYHKSLRRKVALKQLPAAAALDQRWQERFQNEVNATSQLSQANIVPFYELGGGDHSHFYTMQLIDGISLAEVIRGLRQCREGNRPCMNRDVEAVHPAFLKLCNRCKCRFACRDTEPNGKTADLTTNPEYQRAAVELICDAALAVQHAHDQGVLHLDIKPSNILIDGEGKVWVTDFGAARRNGITRSDNSSGTLCYMSAEQTLGCDDQLDARSDVYSLGATLCEFVTLERPFSHSSPHALLTQVSVGKFTPPRETNKAISPELDNVIRKAMAREPNERYASARHLSDDLEAYLTPPPKPTVTSETSLAWRRGHIFAAVLTTIALVALLAVAPWQDSYPSPVYEWNGHFYALTESEVDWVSAEAEAVSHGGHLITINEAEEQAFVESTFLSPPDNVFWIGMTDAEKEGDWHWVSGEPVEYKNWENPGEPNNVIRQDPATGHKMDEDYGVINWHLIVMPPPRRACTWNDINSSRDNDKVTPYRGIMEFESDPR